MKWKWLWVLMLMALVVAGSASYKWTVNGAELWPGMAWALEPEGVVVVPTGLPDRMAMFGPQGRSCPYKEYAGQVSDEGIVFDVTEYMLTLCPSVFHYAGFIGPSGWFWIAVPNGQYNGDMEVTQDFTDCPDCQQIKIWPNDGRFGQAPPLILKEPQTQQEVEVVRMDNFHFLVKLAQEVPPPPPPQKSLACLLASKNLPPELFDDEEILIAVDLWVADRRVPGTREVISDKLMLEIVLAWIDDAPCSRIQTDALSLAVSDKTEPVVWTLRVRNFILFTSPVLDLAESARVQIFNLSGWVIFDSGFVAGNSLISWDFTDSTGLTVANGVYLYTITVRSFAGETWQSKVKKLVVLR